MGFAALETKEETAFRTILRGSKPRDDFKALLGGATIAGRLYALLGLKLLGDPAFGGEYLRLARSAEAVETMEGCIAQRTTPGKIARGILDGEIG